MVYEQLKSVYERVKKPLIAGVIALAMLSGCSIHYNATFDHRENNIHVRGSVSGHVYYPEKKNHEPPYIDMSGWVVK
ncbi:MAG: hypothetical protein GXN99_03115 [Candidatus Nanohaloarchaeota archaeon]|nr:hypothetical protein [Candidatus Nanohaloarchaeota archaeon]